MILQLRPSIPVDSPKGPADAILVIDYGEQQHLLFVTAVRETGEFWIWPAKDVKLEKNITLGIRTGDK